MRDLNETAQDANESGWDWIAFWLDHMEYWKLRFQSSGDQYHLDSIDRCWRMVEMELF